MSIGSVTQIGIRMALSGASAVQSQLRVVGAQVDEFGNATSKMAGTARSAFAVLGASLAGLATSRLIKVADDWGQYASRIRQATESTEEYDRVQSRMLGSSRNTFRAINETRESFIQLSPTLRQMGMSLDQSIDTIDTFSGLLVTNAASADRAKAAQSAYSGALQKGKIDADAWMTIAGTMPSVIGLIANASGKSEAEIRKLGASGKLSVEGLSQALLRGNASVMAQVAEMPTTVGDAMQNVRNAFTELVGAANEANGGTATVAESIGELAKILEDPKVINAAHSLTSGVVTAFKVLANGITGVVNVVRWGAEELAATLHGPAADDIVRLQDRQVLLQERLAVLQSDTVRGAIVRRLYDPQETKQELDKVSQHITDFERWAGTRKPVEPPKIDLTGNLKDIPPLVNVVNDSLDELGKGSKKVSSEARAMQQALQQFETFLANTAGAAEDAELSLEDLTDAERALAKFMRGAAWDQIGPQRQQIARANTEMAASAQRAAQMEREHRTAIEQSQQRSSDRLGAIEDQIEAQKRANAAIGKTPAELARLEVAYKRTEAAAVAFKAETLRIFGASVEEVEMVVREAERLYALADAIEQGQSLETAQARRQEHLKKMEADYERTAQTIGDTLADYIMGGGKDAAQYLKRLFSTLVLQPIVQMGGQGIMSMFGLNTGAAQGGASGLMAQAGQGMQLLQTGRNLYNAITGGFGSISNTVSQGVQSAINLARGTGGTAMQGPVQTGGAAQGLGTAASYAAGIAGGIYGGRMLSGGYSAIGGSSGNTAVNVGTAIGTIWGPLGSLVGGLIGGAVNRLFGRKLVDSGIGGTFDFDDGFEGYSYERYKGGLFRSNKTRRNALDGETADYLADTFATVIGGVANMASQIGLEIERLNSYEFTFDLSTRGLGEEALQTALADVFERASTSAADMLMSGNEQYIREAETSVDALTRLSGALGSVNSMLDTLGHSLYTTSIVGADMASQLVDLFGGSEAMQQVSSSYLDRYYTDTEKTEIALRQLTAAFGGLGVALPESKTALRQLIEAQDLTTDSGRDMYAALMMLSGAFADVHDVVSEVVTDIVRSAADIAKENSDLQRRMWAATGNTAAIAAEDRSQIDKSNLDLYDAVLLAEAQKVLDDQVQAMLASIFNMTASIAEQRAAEIAALPDVLRPMQERLHALQDEAKAMQAAAAAEQAREQQRGTLESQYWQLIGNTAALRRKELDVLDPANHALQQHITLMSAAATVYGLAATHLGDTSGLQSQLDYYRAMAQTQTGTDRLAALQQIIGLEQSIYNAQQAQRQKMAEQEQAILNARRTALQQELTLVQRLQAGVQTAATMQLEHLADPALMQRYVGDLWRQFGAATDDAARTDLLGNIVSAEQAIGRAQQTARAAEQQSINARLSAISDELRAAQALASTAKTIADYVQQLRTGDLSGLSETERLTALRSDYSRLMGRARSGDADALQELQSVSGEMLKLEQLLGTSMGSYSVIAGRVSAELDAVAALNAARARSTESSLTYEQEQLQERLNVMGELVGLSQGTLDAIGQLYNGQSIAYTSQIDTLNAQLAALDTQSNTAAEQFAVSDATKTIIAELLQQSSDAWSVQDVRALRLHEDINTHVNDAIVPELQSIVAAVGSMGVKLDGVRAALAAIAASTRQTAEQIDTVTAGGNAMAVDVMNKVQVTT